MIITRETHAGLEYIVAKKEEIVVMNDRSFHLSAVYAKDAMDTEYIWCYIHSFLGEVCLMSNIAFVPKETKADFEELVHAINSEREKQETVNPDPERFQELVQQIAS